jgi:hypothetical protein
MTDARRRAGRGAGERSPERELPSDDAVGRVHLDPADAGGAFRYFNDRQIISLVQIDDGRVVSVDPLTVYDGSNITVAARHELQIDLACDSYGGTIEGAAPIVAEITGIPMATPDTGEVTVNGESHEVAVGRCSRTGDDLELEAESADGSIALSLSGSAGFTLLFFSIDGRVLTASAQVQLQLEADRVRSAVPVSGEIAGRGPAEVTFDLPCSGCCDRSMRPG